MPDLQRVQSSNIEAVGHEADQLHVQFKGNPKVYVYPGVSADLHRQMVSADSIGSFFAKNIRGKFPHKAD